MSTMDACRAHLRNPQLNSRGVNACSCQRKVQNGVASPHPTEQGRAGQLALYQADVDVDVAERPCRYRLLCWCSITQSQAFGPRLLVGDECMAGLAEAQLVQSMSSIDKIVSTVGAAEGNRRTGANRHAHARSSLCSYSAVTLHHEKTSALVLPSS
ncbi:hypothetical protein AXG93_1527s1150 [Marchantia polymorpha subsp. ruderalis]|uniref:Uncharacterized protein n=1 Tax=Marchantia polymorpha subsp. ruderalis TaxID=1480154 RepID=A0A176W9W0_MARPO|nr:hypothetical protein AXG93_1527s1150 [Marchantia polymorpha subsp. ruderalis]